MGTKNNPGNIDCYASALPDEHVFVLLGRDLATPATIRFWMGERARLGKNVEPDDLRKLGEAGQVADAAEAWRAKIMDSLDALGDEPPWRHRQTSDYDRDPPVRAEGAWSGDQGGAVRVQEIPGWDEWVVAGSIALARRHANSPAITLTEHAQLIAATERSGWHLEQVLQPNRGGGYEVLFRRVDYVFSHQSEPLRYDHTSSLSEAVQDNLHLRAKMVVGLNQVANDMHAKMVSDGWESFDPATIAEFVDRINGHAAELGDGVPVDMIPLPQADPARGSDTSHAVTAEVEDEELAHDLFDGPQEEVLHLTPDLEVERPCDPLMEDCTGLGRGLQP